MKSSKIDKRLHAFLDELYAFGQSDGTMCNVSPETGQFLRMLVVVTRATRILEIGTSNGYSTIWLALGAKETGGEVASIEIDPRKVIMARRNFVQADVSRQVEMWQGDATVLLRKRSGLLDLVFIDGAKDQYLKYYQLVLPMMREGGLIIADNAISHADEMREFLDTVASDPRVESVLVPIGSGLQFILTVG
jgi:predicted O-methyltransferase YrrM